MWADTRIYMRLHTRMLHYIDALKIIFIRVLAAQDALFLFYFFLFFFSFFSDFLDL